MTVCSLKRVSLYGVLATVVLVMAAGLDAQSPTFKGFTGSLSYTNITGNGGTTLANQVSMAKGHFRGPGQPLDLAVADSTNEEIEIWFGNGDGTFQRPTSAQIYSLPPVTSIYPNAPPAVAFPTTISPAGNTQIAAADLSGTNSGYDDIVLANFQGPGTITLLQNNHSSQGTFTASLIPAVVNNQNYVTNEGGSISIAIGDFNGDGFPDLAIGNANTNYATGTACNSGSASCTISVVFNNAGGAGAYNFATPVSYSAGIQTVGIAAANLQGSNTAFEDIVATDGANVYVLLNNKVAGTTGNFPSSPSQTIAINANTIQAINGIITADVNDDGFPDVIAEDQFGDKAVLINDGGGSAGTLGPPSMALPDNFAAVAGNFDTGTAFPGLILLASGGIEYLPNNSGTLGTPVVLGPDAPGYEIGTAVVAGEFNSNNDTNLDVVAASGSEMHVLLGNGHGGFETTPSYLESAADPAETSSNYATSIAALAVGNLHGSGSIDTVSADIGSADTQFPNAISALVVRLASTAGTLPASGTTVIFQAPETEAHFNWIALGNFGGAGAQAGGSGAMDIAAGTTTGDIYIFQNNGSGGFTETNNSPISTGLVLSAGVAGDFRGHGGAPTDIAAIGAETNANNFNGVPESGSVTVILGNGNGTFVQNNGAYGTVYQGTLNAAGAGETTFVNPAQLTVGSLGGSNYPDIVVADAGETYPTGTGGGVWVLRNDGLGDGLFNPTPQQVAATSAYCCGSRTAGPSWVALGKIFGSAYPDIVAASSWGIGQFLNVFQNNGTYSFPITPANTYPYGGQVAIADVNQDGTPDVVVSSDVVEALLNTTGYAGANTSSGILLPWDPSYTAGPAAFPASQVPQSSLVGVGYLPGSIVPNVLVGDAQPAVDVLLNAISTSAAPPSVTGIGPSSGPTTGGTSITINGTNFIGTAAVMFGNTPAAGFNVVSATEITATAPAGTGTVDVTVTTPGGTSPLSAADQFTYIVITAGVSPTTLSFGLQLDSVGAIPGITINALAGTPQTVTLTNTSPSANLTGIIPSVTGANAGDFTATGCGTASTPGTLSWGANCAISVVFAPSLAGGGPESATLSIADNATGAPQTISLSGTGAPFVITSPLSTVATILAGGSGTLTFNLTLGPGTGTLVLSCSALQGVLPTGANCQVSEGSGQPSSQISIPQTTMTQTVAVTVTITTTGSGIPSRRLELPPSGLGLWTPASLISMILLFSIWMGLGAAEKRRAKASWAFLALILLCGGWMAACTGSGSGTGSGSSTSSSGSSSGGSSGGGSSSGGSGSSSATPTGSYTFALTAKLGSATQTIQFTVNVQ